MAVVRRILTTTGLAGALLLAPGGTAWAATAPSPAPSTTTDCGQVAGGTASPVPPGTVCTAGGLNPGTATGAGTPQRLPRTGPAPVLPTLASGLWLVLLGGVVAFAGRRRTARD